MAGRRRKTGPGDGAASIYDFVRAKILSLEPTPGSALDEASIVKRYGVSRTPVREAIDLCQRAVTAWAATRRRPARLAAIRERALDFDHTVKAGDVDALARSNNAVHLAIAAGDQDPDIVVTASRVASA